MVLRERGSTGENSGQTVQNSLFVKIDHTEEIDEIK